MSMADRDGWIWYDGKMVPWRDATTHVLTHTLHYGLGVFEGVRCYKTRRRPRDLPPADHTDRLFNSARIFAMKIPFEQGELMAAQRDVRARATSSTPATCGRSRSTAAYAMGVARQAEPGARRDRRVAVGRVPRRRRRSRRASACSTSSFTHHHPNITMCNAQGRGQLLGVDPRQPGSDARRLRGGDAARPAGLRVPGLGRERVHRAQRQAAHARPVGRRAQRHHARHDHHVRARARHPGASSGASRATSSTSPTRRSSPAPPPK